MYILVLFSLFFHVNQSHGEELSHADAEGGEALRELIPVRGLQVPLHVGQELGERLLERWSIRHGLGLGQLVLVLVERLSPARMRIEN